MEMLRRPEIILKQEKIYWTNYHMHSHYCDGEGELEAYVIRAIEKGMLAIGFSSHAPIPCGMFWHMKKELLCEYIKEMSFLKNKYHDDIKIYSGLEVDYIPNVIGPSHFRDLNLDIIIGSVHYAGMFENGENCIIEYTEEKFVEGLELIFNNNIIELVRTYYDNIISMVNNDPPDLIGHFDIIKKFNYGNKFFNEKDRWYQNIVAEVIKVIAKKKCVVEINTRGYYKGITEDFYPSRWILEKCLEYNIPITISSDAHQVQEIDSGFEAAASLLIEIGYKHVYIFIEGKWCKADLKAKGLVFK
ncbi:MAG: histidinol-phosphatase HisJ [Labilibaculum sp.]|nr:histidinol-phosphatase HisJ [Labilibaculum sp.]MBI9060171.1 histidinol-phosphatase HisJ [Labilibaculum sp.]